MKKVRQSLLVVAATLLIVSCGSEAKKDTATESPATQNSGLPNNTPKGQASVVDNISDNNILQVAIGSPDHTTLVAAVEAAEIEHVLVNAGPLTVFAPNNAAFDALPEGTLEDLLKPENKGTLAGILTMHTAPGSFDVKQLKKEAEKGRKIYTASGDYFEVTVEGEDVFVAGAKVLGVVNASNGFVTVVDKVLSAEDSKK